MVEATEDVRLNLGGGNGELPGFITIDRKNGGEVYPLAYADGAVSEIRASHVLEHFSHRQAFGVVKDWMRALRPGGLMRLAVPDFDWIVDRYRAGDNNDSPLEAYLMGGHTDDNDYHGAIYNAAKLETLMKTAGLEEIKPWTSEIKDCASLPVSLNRQGTKPLITIAAPATPQAKPKAKIHAAMSVPRLGFMDNFFAVFQALLPLGIQLRKHTGVFWGPCLERCMDECITEGAELLLGVDYDTVFRKEEVQALLKIMEKHPEIDALAPVQANRARNFPLMTMVDTEGNRRSEIKREEFAPETLKVATAHFGCTLIRVASLQKMKHPWFMPQADAEGKWGDGRVDADIAFWRQWNECGNTLHLANRVIVAHCELQLMWLDENMNLIYQNPGDYWVHGPPATVWK